ncbi:hypothetical protein GCM10009120_18740 [Sphingobacterium siyangense subsp. cladoniae]|uniref:hypothetical protein n=1 Tax=Sphingobacterium siyangense TaxID=459529 RepID=UPI0031F79C81
MKILKRGVVSNPSKKINCDGCTSELEYTAKDIQFDRDGSYIVCPVCKKFLGVTKQENTSRLED